MVADLGVVTFEAMPFSAIGATLTKIDRIKGTDKARFAFQLDSDDLQWHTDSIAQVRQADIAVSGAALGSVFEKNALASDAGIWKLTVPLAAGKGADSFGSVGYSPRPAEDSTDALRRA